MARANLKVSAELTEGFLSAQADGSVTRLLKVLIAEEEMGMQSLVSKVGSAESDFGDVLLASVSDTEAALILYCLSDGTGSSSLAVKQWLFLLWVPDNCKVRDKMLYSSSKEDLKRTLGQGYFTAEYSANARGDLTWSGFQESLRKERSSDMLSFAERTVFAEKIASHAESSATKSAAMNVLPFTLTPELLAALAIFREGQTCNLVEMTVVDGDSVSLVSSKTVAFGPGSNLQTHVNENEARFFALRLGTASFFVFSCPESTPIRQKMTMASAKATVLGVMSEQGLVFDKNLEIRDAADIDETLRQELEPETGLGPSSSAASLTAAKPVRPGQKARTITKAKFALEE